MKSCFLAELDKDIEKYVKTCRGYAMAAKALPVKFNPWPKIDRPWQRLPIDFVCPKKRQYYLIVVDSFSKWPEAIKF